METSPQAMTSFNGMTGGSNYSNRRNKKNKVKSGVEEVKVKDCYVRKYSNGIPLAEQILIGGRAKFLQIIDGTPKLSSSIDLSKELGIRLYPHQMLGSVPPIIEYEYNDEKEIEYFIELASRMSIEDIYFLAKSIFKDVIATNEKELIVLLAIDMILSFFQDLFVTVHYVVLTGPPGWGKGAILVAFKLVGYRVILAGDISGANLLDLLGSTERCQVTIAEDELDNIKDDPDKERIYKMGYEDIGLVTRTVDPSSSDRTIRFYNPYCLKIFASEKGPDPKELGGFTDRLFRSEVKKGRAKFLIKEIKKQMERPLDKQLPKYRTIVSRINFLRKASLIFRMLHHDDTIEEVLLNIYGRPLELCGPAIRLFNSDSLASPDRKALTEVMDCLSHFLRKKGELDKKTIEAVLYDVLEKLFRQMDIEEEKPGTSTILNAGSCKKQQTVDMKIRYVIKYDEICQRVMNEVDGNLISQRTFESPDYPRVTHDSLLEKCRNIFGGSDADLGSRNEKRKAISFDRDAVTKAGENFEIISEIKILDDEDSTTIANDRDDSDSGMWDHWTGGTNGGGSGGEESTDDRGSNGLFSGQYGDKGHKEYDQYNDVDNSCDLRNGDIRNTEMGDSHYNNSNTADVAGVISKDDTPLHPNDEEKLAVRPPDPDFTLKSQSNMGDKLGSNSNSNETDKDKDEDPPPWIKENRGWTNEEAEAYKAKVASLGKAAAAAKANLSGSGVLGDRDK